MGNRTSTASQRGEGNGMSLFDIASLIVTDQIPITPMAVPLCLDELVDWTEEAATIVNHMADTGINVLLPDTERKPVCFIPLARIGDTDKKIVTQKDVTRFPDDCAFERTAFYHQHTVICIQELDLLDKTNAMSLGGVSCTLSGLNFCIYLKLIRRLSQLMDLDDSLSLHSAQESISDEDSFDGDKEHHAEECGICMARPQDTVLPCLHGVCSTCEAKWIETHYDCPFCRQKYTNQRRRQKEQWNLEHWSKDDAERDMAALVQQIDSFWNQHATPLKERALNGFSRLESSLQQESLVDEDYVLLD